MLVGTNISILQKRKLRLTELQDNVTELCCLMTNPECMVKTPPICPLNEVRGNYFSKVACYLLETKGGPSLSWKPLALHSFP